MLNTFSTLRLVFYNYNSKRMNQQIDGFFFFFFFFFFLQTSKTYTRDSRKKSLNS